MKQIGNKIYGVCQNCGDMVCLNKFLFGSLHQCTTEEEREKYPEQIRRRVKEMEEKFKRM